MDRWPWRAGCWPHLNVPFYARLQCAEFTNAGKPTGADLPGCRWEQDSLCSPRGIPGVTKPDIPLSSVAE
jgi:hypothetical protein